jgi:hypothetical protein
MVEQVGQRKEQAMKKMILASLVVAMFVPAFAADLELTEQQTPEEWAEVYKPHRDAGHEAMAEKRFEEARKEFVLAASGTRFAWVRARMLANAGFAVIRAGRIKEADALYMQALAVQDVAEDNESGGSKFAKDRAQCRADIEWGLKRCQELGGTK